jgi:oxalate decarboxylase/phosphoglucose isomerase-like protein (cupin superfamily)
MNDSGLITPESRVYVAKGWGYEDWLYNGDYCGKILFIKRGKRCSWHFHHIKDEVIHCQAGSIEMLYGDSDDISAAQKVVMKAGDAFRVKPGLRHQMIALEDATLFEASTHHEDSDSIRVIKGD